MDNYGNVVLDALEAWLKTHHNISLVFEFRGNGYTYVAGRNGLTTSAGLKFSSGLQDFTFRTINGDELVASAHTRIDPNADPYVELEKAGRWIVDSMSQRG